MEVVRAIAYRYLTKADFYNIYRPEGVVQGGGGQQYIDFPTGSISLSQWEQFFASIEELVAEVKNEKRHWNTPVHSLGIAAPPQTTHIHQRRSNTVAVAGQRITEAKDTRLSAWHPSNGFPQLIGNEKEPPLGLLVYLVSTVSGKIWAGWFQEGVFEFLPFTGNLSKLSVFQGGKAGNAGYLSFTEGELTLDETILIGVASATQPNPIPAAPIASPDIDEELLNEDVSGQPATPAMKEVVRKIRVRNNKAIKQLKKLYHQNCQITGTTHSFQKKDGSYYSEGHHLVPLGEGGADSPHNIVVINPLVHRMLHTALVEGLDLANVKTFEDGHAELQFTINKQPYKITWHPKHAQLVLKQQVAANGDVGE
ncbi:MAG: hypothetical protein EBQ92_01140 [Proteobacteria bacterium]|nr:hypothetical protein [Pseudomonadota bacterium]